MKSQDVKNALTTVYLRLIILQVEKSLSQVTDVKRDLEMTILKTTYQISLTINTKNSSLINR